jgi:hypothetical protein
MALRSRRWRSGPSVGCLLKARRGLGDRASLLGRCPVPSGIERIEGQGGFEPIGACEVNVARHLITASAAKVGVKEEEREAGLELVVAEALPRPQPRTA